MILEKMNTTAEKITEKLNSLSYGTRVVLAIIGLLFPYLLMMTFLILRKKEYAITTTIVLVINLASIFAWEVIPFLGIIFSVFAFLSGLASGILWIMGVYYFIRIIVLKKQ